MNMEALGVGRVTFEELERALTAVDNAVVFVKSRVLRRVVWFHYESQMNSFQLLRFESYVVNKRELLKLAHPRDLPAAAATGSLPEQLILIAYPSGKTLHRSSEAELRRHYWRILFHSRVIIALRNRFAGLSNATAHVNKMIEKIGQTEFAEATKVLHQEEYLFDPQDTLEAYVRFVALYCELQAFEPELLPIYFPALEDREDLDGLLAEDVDSHAIFDSTRPEGAEPVLNEPELAVEKPAAPPEAQEDLSQAQSDGRRTLADEALAQGNNLRAAIIHTRLGTDADHEKAKELFGKFTRRFQNALPFASIAAEEWYRALIPLIFPAASGFWNVAARLLYDLQRVCVDHERGIYSVNLITWARSLGKIPLQQELPCYQRVLLLKHLRKAYKKLSLVPLTKRQRDRIGKLLREVIKQAEYETRNHFRPLVMEALETVGFRPQNVPERVAREKLREELLDTIVETGMLNMSQIRDAVSRNQLKLEDLSQPSELLRGDQLLQLNKELNTRLDAVYRPGEFYLRWLQTITSLVYGTLWGRVFMKWLVIPFGGAFMVVNGIVLTTLEIMHFFENEKDGIKEHGVDPTVEHEKKMQEALDVLTAPWNVGLVLVLGAFILAMIKIPRFRAGVFEAFRLIGLGIKFVVYDLPSNIPRFRIVRLAMRSEAMLFFRRCLLKPLVLGIIAWLITAMIAETWHFPLIVGTSVFMAFWTYFSTRVGQITDEIISDWLLATGRHLSVEVLPALLEIVVQWFRKIVFECERFLYSFDEKFRFTTSGASAVTLWGKAFLGVIWSAVSYVVRAFIILIAEPGINPVKHFPVVTVAGKFMLIIYIPLVAALDWGPVAGTWLFVLLVLLAPGIFGFLVWELKENWRLYAANRPETLQPVRVGNHGETMRQLLKPGFHSGTLPNEFRRLRKASVRNRPKDAYVCEKHLHQVEEDVRHFVHREFINLMLRSEHGKQMTLRVGKVSLCVTRVQVEIHNASYPDVPLILSFDLLAGHVVAKKRNLGWLEVLDEPTRAAFDQALGGLYKLSGVSFVDQDIRAALPDSEYRYELTPTRLLVWPSGDVKTLVIYPLHSSQGRLLPISVFGGDPSPKFELDAGRVLFAENPIFWGDWVEFWESQRSAVDTLSPAEMRKLVSAAKTG
ncbi:MAG: hypothetical protein ACFCD0_28840 [Gemmataceae bacterium]